MPRAFCCPARKKGGRASLGCAPPFDFILVKLNGFHVANFFIVQIAEEQQ